jgi:hypothetical protein
MANRTKTKPMAVCFSVVGQCGNRHRKEANMKTENISAIEFANVKAEAEKAEAAHKARAEDVALRRVLQDAAEWVTKEAISKSGNKLTDLDEATEAIRLLLKAAAWFNHDATPVESLRAIRDLPDGYRNIRWWAVWALDAAGLSYSHFERDSWECLLPCDSKPKYFQLPWIYDLSKILNNLAEKRGWATRYATDGSVKIDLRDEDDPGPDQYVWSEDPSGFVCWYISSTGRTVARFKKGDFGRYSTVVWHDDGGNAYSKVELSQTEAEVFDWSFGKL